MIGNKLQHYTITAKIGEGGMGEVYRAEDSKLGREVAIKVLPADTAKDPERLRRFDQEARAASALNHPNILTVYDLGTEGDAPFIVMELLEGESLRARLARETLPVQKVIEIAVQIARGLAAAHERGIVHRDLKPENVFLTNDGHVKILDFGLAKLRPDAGTLGENDGDTAETATGPGVILGTAGYMAPEQVRGEVADHRTDLFAFGAILYEMLAGQRAFSGDTSIETLNAILKNSPDEFDAAGRGVPPSLQRTVQRCLEKRPEDRFQSSRDLAFDLETIEKTSSSHTAGLSGLGGAPDRMTKRERRWMLAAAVLGAAFVGLAAALILGGGAPQTTRGPIRFEVPPPPDTLFTSPELGGAAVLSPDGRTLLFVSKSGGASSTRLWVRPLDAVDSREVPGTEGAEYPFWSPDSRIIAFFADGALKRVELAGGPPQTICEAPTGRGGSWGADGTIVFAPVASGALSRVAADGFGEPQPLTELDQSRGEISHRFPAFLEGDRRFLYLAKAVANENEGIYLGSLDGEPARLLVPGPFNGVQAPPNFILYPREGALVARELDPRSAELEGEQMLVAPALNLATLSRGYATFSAARGGVLAYQTGEARTVVETRLVWMDREGNEIGLTSPPGSAYGDPAVSPDGTQIVANFEVEGLGTQDLSLIDVATGHVSRLTFDQTDEWCPVWSPDGREIAYGCGSGGSSETICVKAASGAGEARVVLDHDRAARPTDWSADGRFIIFESGPRASGRDLWVLPVEAGGFGAPFPFVATEADEYMGQLSPDGAWMAYVSKESGRPEVYVRPFSEGGGRWQISFDGGTQPRWRGDGKEIFYAGLDQTIVAVPVETGQAGFRTGRAEPLFQVPLLVNSIGTDDFVPSPDGRRFLVAYAIEESGLPTPITVVLDWDAAVTSER